MAGAFSGHLIDSFLTTPHYRAGPFGQPVPPSTPTSSQLSIHGALAFAPDMHGTFTSQSASDATPDPACPQYMSLTMEGARRIATLQAKLDKKPGPEFISQRPGPGGGPKLTYIEGWRIIGLANEVFGFNGWSSSVVSLSTDYLDQAGETGRYSVGITAIVRVTIRDGTFHEDVGYGQIENVRGKGAALDKCKKEAVTDGIKRALRSFGNLLGNCLYDKAFTKDIVKIKVPPPKFDKSELHRRPEFADPAPATSSNAPSTSYNAPQPQQVQPQVKPEPSVSVHPRSVSGPAISSAAGKSPMGLASHTTPVRPNNAAPSNAGAVNGGLITPAQTPAQQQPRQNASNGAPHRPPDFPKAQSTSAGAPAPTSASDKRVSFAQSAASTSKDPAPTASTSAYNADDDDDDLYGLNSEDDALFAAVDLGEGDSGIGGHINFDEGMGGVTMDDDDDTPEPVAPVFAIPRAPALAGQAQRQEPSGRPPPPPQNGPAGPSNAPGPSMNSTPSTASSNGRLSATHTNPSKGPPSSSSSSKRMQMIQAALSPGSVGGFNFSDSSNGRPAAPPTGPSSGMKRSADAMQPATGSRRPMQGMGLSHQPPAQQRQPLSTIEGGDLKRVKR